MRILHVSDFHFVRTWYKWVEERQTDFDVICLTGDLIDEVQKTPIGDQIAWVEDWFARMKTPVLSCSGNHDLDDVNDMDWLSRVPFSDNNIHDIKGVKFGAVPYIGENYEDFLDCDIILRHVPPAKTPISFHERREIDFGDEDFYEIVTRSILRPKLILSGHIHYPYEHVSELNGVKLYNPGRVRGLKEPKHLIIDWTD